MEAGLRDSRPRVATGHDAVSSTTGSSMSSPSRPTRRPSRWWYALVAALAVAGAVAGGAIVGDTVGGTFRDAQTIAAGETATVALEDGDVRGLYSSGDVPEFGCLVLPPTGGDEPIVTTNVPDTSATLNGIEWQLFAEVTARETGIHSVRCESTVSGSGEFGIGPAPTARGVVVPLLAGFALAVLGGVLAVVLGVFVALRRARSTTPPSISAGP